jgi:hypothetical protein
VVCVVPADRERPTAAPTSQLSTAREFLGAVDTNPTGSQVAKPSRPPTPIEAGSARTDTDRKLRNHIRQIQALGFTVTLTKAA